MPRLRKMGSSATVMGSAAVLMAALCQSGFAQTSDANAGQTALGKAEVVHAQVRVVAIYPATNSVTLRGPHGNLADVDVNPRLADVRKLRVGDTLNVAYQQALLLQVDKQRGA